VFVLIKKIALREYFSGALLANVLIFLLSAFGPITFFGESIIQVALATYVLTMVGGAWAGFLVARKTGQNYVKVGFPIGLISYCFYGIFITLMGVKGGFIEDFAPLFGFLVGGAMGARYWEIRVLNAKKSKGQ